MVKYEKKDLDFHKNELIGLVRGLIKRELDDTTLLKIGIGIIDDLFYFLEQGSEGLKKNPS